MAEDKPLILFDGDCGFCRWWVGRWMEAAGGKMEARPYQEGAPDSIPRERLAEAIHFLLPDGRVFSGAQAVFWILKKAEGRGWPLGIYRKVPGAAALAELAYGLVASHRNFFSALQRWVLRRGESAAEYRRGADLFIRGVGIMYAAAFLPLAVQAAGLIGQNGILPLEPFLRGVAQNYTAERFWLLPTIFWLNASDDFVRAICWIGAGLGVLAAAGIFPRILLAAAWALYLSVTVAGRDFLNFQWDGLLLETGLTALFLTPGLRCLRWRNPENPSWIGLFLVRWLLFRFMLFNGLVKLWSGDNAWWDLSALDYHYETQPLPSPLAWFLHQLPSSAQAISCLLMLGIELGLAFLVFGSRFWRRAALAGFVLLQLAIIASGNHAFFNGLTLVLCLALADDRLWPAALRPGMGGPRAAAPFRGFAAAAAAFVVMVLGFSAEMQRFHWRGIAWAQPFRCFNTYGAFAFMTKTRPEIILEGSRDGTAWEAYELPHKPGDLRRRPDYVAPWQPRLDWQLWFEALRAERGAPNTVWFRNLLGRLLEGRPEVAGLLERNPFPDAPPRYVRAVLYQYRFTTSEERKSTGQWWKRELVGLCSPVLQAE
jgi:predicted DCC family thiol-disulfide oxidoreductase YuxK